MVKIYPVAGKQRSANICRLFLEGMESDRYRADGAVFFGVNESNYEAWVSVRKRKVPYYYIDNSYFDQTRGTYYRVSKNSIQYKGPLGSNGDRARHIGLPPIKPWQSVEAKGHVLLIEQSPTFMGFTVGYLGDWLKNEMMSVQATWPNRPVVVRRWNPNKKEQASSFQVDLAGASVLITHSSAAAVMSMMAGVQTIVSNVSAIAGHTMSYDPAIDQRQLLVNTLADNQWTLEEIRLGRAWEWLANR